MAGLVNSQTSQKSITFEILTDFWKNGETRGAIY